MTNQFHDACDLVCCVEASVFALGADMCWQTILIRFIDRSLMETNSRCVNVHVTYGELVMSMWCRLLYCSPNTIFGLFIPVGSLRCEGMDRDVLSKI